MERLLISLLTVTFLLGTITPGQSARRFEFTAEARSAYDLVLSLRFQEARRQLTQIKLQDPDNLVVYHLEDYIDFFSLYINEDPESYERLKSNRARRLKEIESGNPNSPYFLFAQADIRLHWALVRLKFGEYLGAFTDVSKAYKLLKENQARFPRFMPNYKDLGILHALVGTIPDSYRWGVKLLSGLDGTIEQGRREIEQVMRYADTNDFIFEDETRALYAFLLLHLENEGEAAWESIRRARLRPRQNLLHCFLLANMAMRTDRNDEAIRILQQRPAGDEYFDFYYLDFMLGVAKLRRLDSDADIYLKRYTQHFDGQNFIKEAYQKLAWHELVHGRPAGYRRYMEACRRRGAQTVGADKSAQREAEGGHPPDVPLLKARLLFDGGYMGLAYRQLAGKTEAGYSARAFRLEFLYRMGRILHGLKQYPEAIHYYQRTIRDGRHDPAFYACNAAIQTGLIYENLQMPEQAIHFFEEALAMEPDEYRTGLHQRAKSGLARLRETEN